MVESARHGCVPEAARADVERGAAPSLSAAVEEALLARRRARAMREALDMWEEEFGPIPEEAKEWARREIKRVSQEPLSSTPEP